nr:methionyl-tRNA formyltransferase [Treponema sp.]
PGTVLPYRKSVGIEIACGQGSVLVVSELQLEKKKAMDYKSFLNGARNFIGSILG